MASETPQKADGSAVESSVRPTDDATLLVGPSDSPDSLYRSSKLEYDMAFAAALLRTGVTTERQVALELDRWTIHGHVPLGDHLVEVGLLEIEEKARLDLEAQRALASLDDSIDSHSESLTNSQVLRARQNMLDGSGRIAKLLGTSSTSGFVVERQSRQLFSQYTLMRKLGQGGLGTVWLARDENLRRYVAIKEIRSRGGNAAETTVQRFRREAEITGRLEHPGIVPIYQFGTDPETGRSFYVMRFQGKKTLQDAIAEYHERRESGNGDPLLLHRLLTAFSNLCKAVDHAHSRNVIHRDLKPENVALNNYGQIVLLDWGLAKLQDETGLSDAGDEEVAMEGDDQGVTVSGQVLGSPMYMAPEQAAGRVDEIDERTDIFGLGGILFTILTGATPHEQARASILGQENASMLSAIVAQQVPSPRKIVTSVPKPLEAICQKATQKKRYLRYKSVTALADDVEHYLAGGKVAAYDEPTVDRLRHWVAEHRLFSQIVGALLAILLITFTVVGFASRQSQAIARQARFGRLEDLTREIEIEVRNDIGTLSRNLQFLSALPPVDQLAELFRKPGRDTRVQTPKARPQNLTGDEEDVSIWQDRLSTIFDGLLRGHSSYLQITLAASGEETVHEVVSSNRQKAGSWVRRVPASRLSSFPMPLERRFDNKKPGDVSLLTTQEAPEGAPVERREPLLIVGLTPIFNQAGEEFGAIAIEFDLQHRIRNILRQRGRDASEVFITDSTGLIHVHWDQESAFGRDFGKQLIGEVVPELHEYFSGVFDPKSYTNGETVYAKRLRLGEDATEAIELGIVVRSLAD